MQSRRQSQFGWQPWATQYDAHMFQMFRSKEFSEMFQFSGEDLWFLRLLALFYILGKWWNSDMFQMSKSTGKFFVGELRFQVCSSRTICVEQMCLKRIPFVCPTNIFMSHGMRRGGAKQRRKQYAKVATRDTHGFDPIGVWKLLRSNGVFFVVASSHWILLVSVRMQNYEMLSCVILLRWISQWSNWKSICRIAGTRDADVTSCFRMPLRGSNETVVKHVIPTSLQLCSGFFTICGLICFSPLGLWPPSTSKNLATLLPAFCMPSMCPGDFYGVDEAFLAFSLHAASGVIKSCVSCVSWVARCRLKNIFITFFAAVGVVLWFTWIGWELAVSTDFFFQACFWPS